MELKDLRRILDDLDSVMISTLSKRMSYVKDVAEYKKNNGVKICHPGREAEIISLRRKQAEEQGLNPDLVEEILKIVIKYSHKIQAEYLGESGENKLAYLGPENTFSGKAAKLLVEKLDEELEIFPLVSFDAVAKSVAHGKVKYGVLAYYNYLKGLVQENLDLIYENDLQIIGVQRLPINLSIGFFGDGMVDGVIYSHPKALAQCSDWLWENYPESRQVPVSSTAAGIDKVLDECYGLAIASKDALEKKFLRIIAEDIGNKKHGRNNFTDFYLVSKTNGIEFDSSKSYLTMLAITPHVDESGLLAKILSKIAEFGLNNAKIHSRPALDEVLNLENDPQMFYLEVEAHKNEINLNNCVKTLRTYLTPPNSEVETVRILGSYERT